MEGGQKVRISLESPIDTKSSDMMVSVQDPRFAHNRQQYQGHVLPTSLRFEHDGYAAGWYVYEFDFEGGYIYSDECLNAGSVSYMAASRIKINNFPTYVISFRPAERNAITGKFTVDKAKEFQAWYNDNYEFFDNADVSVSGMTSNGKVTNFTLKYNNVTDSFSFTNLNTSITKTTVNSLTLSYESINGAGRVSAMLTDTAAHWQGNIDIAVPCATQGLTFEGMTTYNNTPVYKWSVDGLTNTYIYARADSNTPYISSESFAWADWKTMAYVNVTMTFTADIPLVTSYISGVKQLVTKTEYYKQISNLPYSDADNQPHGLGYYSAVNILESYGNTDNIYLYDTTGTPKRLAYFRIKSNCMYRYLSGSNVPNVSFKSSAFSTSGYVEIGTFIQKHFTWLDGKDRNIIVKIAVDNTSALTWAGGDRVEAVTSDRASSSAYIDGVSDWDPSSIQHMVRRPGITETVSRDDSNSITSGGMAIDWTNDKNSNYYKVNVEYARVYVELDVKSIKGIDVSSNLNHWLAGFIFTPVFKKRTYGVAIRSFVQNNTVPTSSSIGAMLSYNNKLYVGTLGDKGLYIGESTSQGVVFTKNTSLPSTCSINALTVIDNIVYVGTVSDGLWVSGSDGTTFTQLTFDATNVISSIIKYSSINSIFVGTLNDGLYINNSSTSFVKRSDFPVDQVLCLYEFNSILFVGTETHGLYKWSIASPTFTQEDDLPSNCDVTAMTVFNNKLYVAVHSYGSSNEHRLYSSQNGSAFTQVATFTSDVIALNVWNDTLYAGTLANGLWSSTNGATFTQETRYPTTQTVSSLANFDSTIYAGSYGQGVYAYIMHNEAHYGGEFTLDADASLYVGIWDYDTGEELLPESTTTDSGVYDSDSQLVLSGDKGWHVKGTMPDSAEGYRDEAYYCPVTSLSGNSNSWIITRYATEGLSINYSGAHYSSTNESDAFCNAFFSVHKYNPYFGTVGSHDDNTFNYPAVPHMDSLEPSATNDVTLMQPLYGTMSLYYVPIAMSWGTNNIYHYKLDSYIQTATDLRNMFGLRTTSLVATESSSASYNRRAVDVSLSSDILELTYRSKGHYYVYYDEDTKLFETAYSDSYTVPFVRVAYKLDSVKVPRNTVQSSVPEYAIPLIDYTYETNVTVKRSEDINKIISHLDNSTIYYSIGSITKKKYACWVNTPTLYCLSGTTDYYVTAPIRCRIPKVDSDYVSGSYAPTYNNDFYEEVRTLATFANTGYSHKATFTATYAVGIDMSSIFGTYLPAINTAVVYNAAAQSMTYTVGSNKLVYSVGTADYSMTINDHEVEEETVSITANALNSACKSFVYNSLSWDQYLQTRVYFKPKGIYKVLTYEDTQFNSYGVSGTAYTFNVSGYRHGSFYEGGYVFHFEDFESAPPAKLIYKCTDVRNSKVTKEIGTVVTKDERQLVKQMWDPTVDTENFWWLDDQHVLTLTKEAFVLHKKDDGNLDDWNGDIWTVEKSWYRGDFIPSDITRYIVTSAKNSTGLLLTFEVVSELLFRINVYDPLNSTVDMAAQNTSYLLQINKVSIGNELNANAGYLNTYSTINASTLLAEAKISATHIDNRIIIGIQYDRNMCQWAIIINSSNFSIIQGYGCVGIDGALTGGMIPAGYFSVAKGFTGTVHPLSILEADDKNNATLAELNAFDERIVGDENQQWYISKRLSGIVSHLTYAGGAYTVNTIPLTNTYAQVYKSPSFIKYKAYDFSFKNKPLSTLFGDTPNATWSTIQELIGSALYFLAPYTNIVNYLQQTLGQYAYVHYNSTSRGRQGNKAYNEQTLENAGLDVELGNDNFHIDPITQDDLSFDVVHVAQEQDFGENTWADMLGIIGRVFVSALDMSITPTAVNTMQNQSSVNDLGKKFSQAFLQNINSMSVTGFNQQSTTPALKSEVTAIKTLDMFYSTSADQKCFAGPGFVQHSFVAQCTAQSVTSVQAEAQQTQVFLLVKALTLWSLKLNIALWKALEDATLADIQSQGGTPFLMAGLASGTSFGWLVSLVLSVAWSASVIGHSAAVIAEKVVGELLNDLLPNGVQVNVTAKVSRHNYDIEGKHAYGSKSECFMWPCHDCKPATYTDEEVEATVQDKPWPMKFPTVAGTSLYKSIVNSKPDTSTESIPADSTTDIAYYIASCKGVQYTRSLPADMAYVIGAESFMPTVAFKNENIGESEPVFTIPPIQDYVVDSDYAISMTCTEGKILWVTCKDTKLFDGPYSNIIITDSFCGIAAPHIALEVKREVSQDYTRPYAVSPDCLALNMTGLNCAYEEKIYHAFDGYGYRIVDWLGSAGMGKEHYTWQYCFQKNDRFKRSTKLPPNQFLGNFQSSPSVSVDIHDDLYNEIAVVSEGKGLQAVVAGEDRDQQRYSIPIFTEIVSSLPTIVKSLSPYKLAIFEGITSLTTDSRTILSEYKLPVSVDFTINDVVYRMTNEYICIVDHVGPSEVVKNVVPALGLTFLGATPYAAYLYNQATRRYFVYTGGMNLKAMDMLERFRDIKSGLYDFINQDVTMPCLATFDRLDSQVHDDDDETDNIIIPVFNNGVAAREVTPPVTTIFNTRSWFKNVSLPAGVTFQGPNRCIINRYVWSEYMLEDIVDNKGKWTKVPREEYHPFRDYNAKYNNISTNVETDVKGWTHNPFLLVTAPLGVAEEIDCLFEWEITFAWTVEMEKLIAENEYITVNIVAETMSPGGKLIARPTHVFLTKELFTRSGNYGYYSFRYQSNNGAGNRERLHVWSDGYIAISGLQLEYKVVTEKRNEILTQQADVKGLKEM